MQITNTTETIGVSQTPALDTNLAKATEGAMFVGAFAAFAVIAIAGAISRHRNIHKISPNNITRYGKDTPEIVNYKR